MLRRRQLPIEFSELQSALRAADPSAVFTPAQVLRRIIREHCNLARLGMSVTHRHCFWIERDALLEIADKWELGLEPGQDLAPIVILLARPDYEEMASRSRDELLVNTWRLLFHVRIHLAYERALAGESIDEIERRIEHIGRGEFHELRPILRAQDRLLPPRDARATFIEFAATYLEYRYFSPRQLDRDFPMLDRDRVADIVDRDVDSAGIYAATRLEGAPDPQYVDTVAIPQAVTEAAERAACVGVPQPRRVRWLLLRAERASRLGNNVKAAVLRSRAASVAPRQQIAAIVADSNREMDQLARRLQQALNLDGNDTATLRDILPLLTVPAACGMWPIERRLLYDLQNVCIDHERNVYKVDLLRWIFSLGRTPLKRPLPNQREVLMFKHLRSAVRRLGAARIPTVERERLMNMLEHAVHQSEHHLRTLFRPMLDECLGQVGLKAENLPERVGRNKLAEELADQIIEHGHLNMGNVRDAISRNRLKLKDLHGVNEFLQGDKLLLLNNQFTYTLDGIYHRGEIYLRWLQRLSALAFATPLGRFLVRYVALPFGGAFMVLKFIEELAHIAGSHAHFGDALQITILGSFFLGLFYVPDFRNQIFHWLKLIWHRTRWLLVDLPRDFGRLHTVRAILRSEPVQFFYRNAFKPLLAALVMYTVLILQGRPMFFAAQMAAAVFFVGSLFVNTPWGRRVDERLSSRMARTWHRIHRNIIPGIFRGTMDFFHRVLDAINAGLYAVDEWLRFRQGESRIALGFKAVLGCFWAGVTYVVRACVNLLVEPQINPIKHFPVVTVSHKIILPLALTRDPVAIPSPLAHLLLLIVDLPIATANAIVGAVVWGIPGIFGFLVWELKENWKLYFANQPKTLRPVMIGHHGETMPRLLRPGFHAGTIPKLLAKLRRAEREAERTGDWHVYRKRSEQLHHVEESVRRFIERELIALVNRSRVLRPVRLRLATLQLSDYRIAMELARSDDATNNFRMAFEEQNGWLVADILKHGWLRELPPEQLQAFRTALAGLCKLAGVDLMRPQIRAVLGTREFGFDVVNRGLMVWPRGRSEVSAIYELWNGAELKPVVTPGADFYPFPNLPLNAINFGTVPITWDQWLATWNEDPDGETSSHVHVEAVHVLPLMSTVAICESVSELSGGWKRDLG